MFDITALNKDVFTWNTALSLAMASDLVYQRDQAVVSVATRNWQFDECRFLAKNGTECFVARTDSAIIVAFRGTASLNDWLANLSVWPTAKAYGKVHGGFVSAYDAISNQLIDTIRSFQPESKVIHLTGHSLGAALATIAACELFERFHIAGIYSFGQPRLGDRTTAHFFETKYSHRFNRFVFDDDVVTRIPPGYRQVGRLFHFDSNGFLQQAAGESTGGTTELPELTPEQFEGLQDTARSISKEAKISAPIMHESADELADRSLEGILPSVSDHRMSNYLFAIRNQIPRHHAFLNEATVSRTLEMIDMSTFRGTVRGTEDTYPVQVRVRDMHWTPPTGATVNSQIGPIFSLLATKNDIASMQHDPKVSSLDLGRETDFPNVEECAVSIPFVKADVVHTGTFSENGDQAIVGLIDSGIDILHESFLDANGNSRIEAVWVQQDKSGKTPYQIDQSVYKYLDYGTLYLQNDIQTFVNNDLVVGNNTTPAVLRDQGPSIAQDYGHGTHVASIAAGRAVGTFGGGMAPEARIVVVVPHMKTTPPNPPSLGYSSSHQAALDFLMAYKKSRGLPMAVNVSLGMNAGAHDGMSTLEKVFDSVSLKGKEEGFVIVKSAGNERGHRGHAQVQASTAGIVTIEWDSAAIDRTQDYLEFWYATDDEMTFTLIDPARVRSPSITHNPVQRKGNFSSGGNDIYLDLTVHHPDNDDNLLSIRIIPVGDSIQPGTWILEIQAVSLGPANGIVNGWVERNDDRPVQFLTAASDDMTLSIPGTADTVLSVAASDTSNPLHLHPASSYGLTRKNGAKPDLNAPGDRITAARSNSVDHQAVVTLSGTSMAAPHVTGALALVLSARHKKCLADTKKKQFNAINLAGMLKRSARNYNKLHNKGYGYGGLDAAALYSAADIL